MFFFFKIYFGYEFKIKASVLYEHVMNNQEHVMNNQEHVNKAYEHLRISRMFKHIQGN